MFLGTHIRSVKFRLQDSERLQHMYEAAEAGYTVLDLDQNEVQCFYGYEQASDVIMEAGL